MSDLVPEGWRIENIETIANVGSSKRILQSEYVPSGVPFFRSKEAIRRSKNLPIENPLYISKKRFKELKDKHGAPKKNEILVTAVGTIGVIYLIEDIEFYFKDGNLLWIKHIDEDVSPSYLAKYLASDTCHNAIIEIAGGSSQSALTIEKLSKLEFNLPPLPEQQKIATILSSVDEVIEKTQAQINKLKDLKTGMMQELLSPREGQAANINNPQGESKNGLHHTEFKDSPLGRIPVGWDAVPLSQLVKSERPITYGIVQTGPNIESGIPCVRVVDLMTDAMSLQKMIRTSSTINESYRRTILQSNDIMFALRGSIGHVRMTSPQLVGANLTRGVALISANDSICSKFLLWAIRSPSVRSMIMDGVNGSALQEIPLGNLRNVYIPLPPNEEQIKISKAIDSVEENLTKRRSKLKNYQSLKKALMQDLLTGKVRVKIDAA